MREAHLIASSADGLPSAARDVVAYSTLFGRRGFTLYCYLDVTPVEANRIATLLRNFNVHIETDLILLPQRLALLAYRKVPTDVVVTISSHGYWSGQNYIRFKGKQLPSITFTAWLTPLASNLDVHALVLIDTCHSGMMCNLPLASTNQGGEGRLHAIAACSNVESDRDDLSTEFGFGGGLTSSVADYLGTNTAAFDIKALYTACLTRLRKNAMTPQLRAV
ncbi:Hypothetical protein POVN_LOCUS588 [uncultured virus]|nr:Hypothetical protein POVN_LOCUS588 [uncultured virus]